jgi:polyphosphate glucokinase
VEGFGIDIGGSGVKGAPVGLTSGELLAPRHRIPTPPSGTPDDIIETVREIVRIHEWDGPVGVTVPAVVVDGTVKSASALSDEWINFPAVRALEDALGVSVSIINDADAAGIAEVRYGAARDVGGVVLLLTFGTGIGSALINDGVLVPNTELGHLEFRGMAAEQFAAARLVEHEGLDLETWAHRVNEFLLYVEMLFSPGLIVFGGGISKRFNDFGSFLATVAPVVPAVLLNNAGIVGAAMTSESSYR